MFEVSYTSTVRVNGYIVTMLYFLCGHLIMQSNLVATNPFVDSKTQENKMQKMQKEINEQRRLALQKFITDVIEGRFKKSRTWWCEQSGIAEGTVRNFINGKNTSLSDYTYQKLAKSAGVKVSQLLGEEKYISLVPLIGYVERGAIVNIMKNYANGEYIEMVDAPPEVAGDIVALQIKGNGMMPIYNDGDKVFYSQEKSLSDEDCLGRQCVVKVQDGDIHLCSVMRGSRFGLYTLYPYNASIMPDVSIEWAAPVQWIDVRKRKIVPILERE